ncbi:protein suppressor of sable [Culicoides brevitarsis]|uniref:protein suppressor of sable n=1 Tax=Culicoides brevitarsis TaxID=469753 RepID=UPI00307CA3CF
MSDKEDLEDGEIEDDEEEEMPAEGANNENASKPDGDSEQKKASEKKPEKIEKRSGSMEDDWTTNVEKTMANMLKKAGVEPPLPNITAKEPAEEPPVPKSRKRRKPKSERNKNKESKKAADNSTPQKRQKMNEDDGEEYADEYEMMNVRGGSPPPNMGTIVLDDDSVKGSSDAESYDSDEYRKMSYEERRQRRREQMRQNRRERSKEREREDRRRDRERERDRRDRERNDDHYDRREPRKLEICKFYLLDCCAKRDKCSYLHSEFPCKYYYLGMKCPLKDCKFNHGKPLTDQFRGILLKHLETAPKEILGDFPRIGREKALKLMDAQHLKLLARERGEKEPDTLSNTPNIPSLLDSIMPKNRNNSQENRQRRSRWCDMNIPPAPTLPDEQQTPKASIPEYMNIKNMTGILTAKQIEQLLEMGIESVDQIKQLTLLQMDNIGLTITQIKEVQENVQNLEKVMLAEKQKDDENSRTPQASPSPPPATTQPSVINKDLDLRIPPPDIIAPPVVVDVDLRFPPPSTTTSLSSLSNVPITSSVALQALDTSKPPPSAEIDEPPIDPQKLQNFRAMFGGSSSSSSLVDFSQYLKDASMKELSDEPAKDDATPKDEQNFPEDDESELQIDESCYSDEERDKKNEQKEDEPKSSDETIMSPVHTQESIIATLKELEKMKQKEQEEKQAMQSTSISSLPTTASYNPAIEGLSTFSSFYEPAPEKTEKPSTERVRRISNEIKSPSLSDSADESVIKRPSIYDHYSDDDENDDYGNIAKKTDKDMRMAAIDTDTGDIDLRLPFKPILASLIPASEINASITAHPPISYKVHEIEIPKPSFRGLKHAKGSLENVNDPRLVRLLGLKTDSRSRRDSRSSDYDSSATPRSPDPVPNKPAPRLDPRQRRREELAQQASSSTLISSPNSTNNSHNVKESNQLDMPGLMVLLQKSGWYQQLNSNSKISVNQTLARLSGEIKKFHQDPASDKVFDLSLVAADPIIQHILNNLGVYLNEHGYFCHVDDTPKQPPPILPNLSQPPPGTLPMNLPAGLDLNVLNNLGSILQQQQQRPNFIPPPRPSLLGMPPPLLTNPLLSESVLGAAMRGLLPPSLNVPPPNLINDNFNRRAPPLQHNDRRGNNWGGNNNRRNNDYRSDPRRNRD